MYIVVITFMYFDWPGLGSPSCYCHPRDARFLILVLNLYSSEHDQDYFIFCMHI